VRLWPDVSGRSKVIEVLNQEYGDTRTGTPDPGAAENPMGKIIYGDSDIEIEFDDRSLTHVQLVIGAKLRRGESFFFSWKDDPAVGDGRSSIWLDRAIPLYFKFFGGKNPTINREWLTILNDSANSGQGLIFTSEPGGTTPPPRTHV
jgi:hypothetical protein